jgi:hypothetical protein
VKNIVAAALERRVRCETDATLTSPQIPEVDEPFFSRKL